ncbi:MAG TPA: ATPase domain-containing protein [Acidobacteriaceae bacterium]|nr:ATPase domain-containing protein [Acidobacteriaceae bacterium]
MEDHATTHPNGSRAASPSPRRISTGVAGIDDILGGGIPSGHLYLVEGDPGTGKTTFALQFLLAGAARGEKCMYVTLSESNHELAEVAASHGWDLDSIVLFEMIPTDEDLSPEAQYTVFHPSDVELADTITAIVKQINIVNPERVVFDSLSEFRMLARDPLKYRRQILALKRHFAGRDCTVLLLDDRTSDDADSDLQLRSLAHGVIKLQTLERDFGISRRRLAIHKLRGSSFREGFHDYAIRTGGIDVYPRLIAAEHNPGFVRKCVPSGLTELDELFGGGIDNGTSTLLMGPAGCGKSTIALRYAISAAERGEKAAVFIFDETLTTLVTRSQGLNMDPTPYIENGTLEIQQIDPAELSPGEFIARIRRLVDAQDLSVVIIDSINGFLNAMPHEQFLAMQLHELFSYLGQQGIATLVTMAQHGFVGITQAPIDVSYLADSVLLFRYFERAGSVYQALSVVKKRSGRHERTIRELVFRDGHVRVGPVLTKFEGVLTGHPSFTGSAEETDSELGQ